ncbi:hypothetical protein BDR26DRAFT_511808 [Obelidium mucronatum]|nr:hypothetical protein BDR26DRAFT_511808 [Obelidium mucronatum]
MEGIEQQLAHLNARIAVKEAKEDEADALLQQAIQAREPAHIVAGLQTRLDAAIQGLVALRNERTALINMRSVLRQTAATEASSELKEEAQTKAGSKSSSKRSQESGESSGSSSRGVDDGPSPKSDSSGSGRRLSSGELAVTEENHLAVFGLTVNK